MARKQQEKSPPPPWELGWRMVREHPLFSAPAGCVWLCSTRAARYDRPPALGFGGYVALDVRGKLWFDPERQTPRGQAPATAAEWAWVFAVMLTHLGFGHLPVKEPRAAWVAAADAVAIAFVDSLKFGKRPADVPAPDDPAPIRTAELLFERFRIEGVPAAFVRQGLAGIAALDLLEGTPEPWTTTLKEAENAFAEGLARAVEEALQRASGRTREKKRTAAHDARDWFVSSFPLLGALAASFEIECDLKACQALEISIAAIDTERQVIYINPAAPLTHEEMRFVMAHELLHAGLRHETRRQGRDDFLWNVACDYVINGWLIEMGVGDMPQAGALHDPELAGLSAEAIYDRIASDLRKIRKLCTLRGRGLGDILKDDPKYWTGDGCTLDAFYRRCLGTGLELHRAQCRGLLPAGLIQEIEALAHPPVPWDVRLAQWFDRFFSPLERYRSFAHPSRRQASTPDIPRPRYVLREDALSGRTFGVVLDTSGSMQTELLACALGAIASFSASRDVPAARVIFCDAYPYDQGYLPVESIAGLVKVRGRGGTVLQPGIDLLEQATDFPKDGPILVITDTECDVLRIRREHAFLVPRGRRLPFSPRGPVFEIER